MRRRIPKLPKVSATIVTSEENVTAGQEKIGKRNDGKKAQVPLTKNSKNSKNAIREATHVERVKINESVEPPTTLSRRISKDVQDASAATAAINDDLVDSFFSNAKTDFSHLRPVAANDFQPKLQEKRPLVLNGSEGGDGRRPRKRRRRNGPKLEISPCLLKLPERHQFVKEAQAARARFRAPVSSGSREVSSGGVVKEPLGDLRAVLAQKAGHAGS